MKNRPSSRSLGTALVLGLSACSPFLENNQRVEYPTAPVVDQKPERVNKPLDFSTSTPEENVAETHQQARKVLVSSDYFIYSGPAQKEGDGPFDYVANEDLLFAGVSDETRCAVAALNQSGGTEFSLVAGREVEQGMVNEEILASFLNGPNFILDFQMAQGDHCGLDRLVESASVFQFYDSYRLNTAENRNRIGGAIHEALVAFQAPSIEEVAACNVRNARNKKNQPFRVDLGQYEACLDQ